MFVAFCGIGDVRGEMMFLGIWNDCLLGSRGTRHRQFGCWCFTSGVLSSAVLLCANCMISAYHLWIHPCRLGWVWTCISCYCFDIEVNFLVELQSIRCLTGTIFWLLLAPAHLPTLCDAHRTNEICLCLLCLRLEHEGRAVCCGARWPGRGWSHRCHRHHYRRGGGWAERWRWRCRPQAGQRAHAARVGIRKHAAVDEHQRHGQQSRRRPSAVAARDHRRPAQQCRRYGDSFFVETALLNVCILNSSITVRVVGQLTCLLKENEIGPKPGVNERCVWACESLINRT